MNHHTMQFLDIIKTGDLKQLRYFYSLYKKCININVCAERPFRLACSKGFIDIANWLYYEISEMTIDITTINHDAIHEVITNKNMCIDNKIQIFHFLETIYRGIEEDNAPNKWFNIGRILEYSIVNEAYDFAQYIMQRYYIIAYDEIYSYSYNCFEHACINGNYMMAEKIRKSFDFTIPEDSAIYINPHMKEYADYISDDIMILNLESMKI